MGAGAAVGRTIMLMLLVVTAAVVRARVLRLAIPRVLVRLIQAAVAVAVIPAIFLAMT